MTASDGSPLALTPHRLRHTLATEMLNQGVSQRAIQDYLDHSSPDMTAVYAKLLDSTLRAEFDAYQQRVNIRGERIAVLPADVPDDAVLLKERIARAKQTLPNGYCGLPLQLECPHPNACLSCDAFLTDARFRPALEDQLDRTRELIGRARAAGHERVIEINTRDEASLVAILDGLDTLEDDHTEAGFDLRDGISVTDAKAAA
jgi:Phage integrase family